jgi:hypothetical protein
LRGDPGDSGQDTGFSRVIEERPRRQWTGFSREVEERPRKQLTVDRFLQSGSREAVGSGHVSPEWFRRGRGQVSPEWLRRDQGDSGQGTVFSRVVEERPRRQGIGFSRVVEGRPRRQWTGFSRVVEERPRRRGIGDRFLQSG